MLTRALSTGDRFGDYVIVRLLGAGGFGAVYEAEHPILGRRVALKITHPDVAGDPDARARALQEARALAELSHPNIVAIHNAGVTPEGQVWIATELLQGWTLREMRRRPLPVEQALALVAEICDGVAAAHDIDILHRDLKPENVFVTRQIAVKVLDFTAAKAFGRGIVESSGQIPAGKQARTVLGTPAYMSPEQARGERVDARTDVYSVGVIAYELMGPHHPFAEADGTMPPDYELARRHAEAVPAPLSGLRPAVPSYVSDVIAEAMVKERERRLPSMRAFAKRLRSARQRLLGDREIEHEALAEEWRGAGSFRRHGTASLERTDDRPRQPSRRVLVQGAPRSDLPTTVAETLDEELSAPEARDARGEPPGPRVLHITAARPPQRARVARRGAVVAVLVATVLLLVGIALVYHFRSEGSAGSSSQGVAP